MFPIIFKIGDFNIYSYGLMSAIAFLVSVYFIVKEAKKKNLDAEIIYNLCFLVFILGIIGARIFFVIENFSYYQKYFWEIFMLWQGGLSWFGGFLAGFLGGIIYLKKKNIPIYPTLDLIAPYLALGQSIGRIGCFLNGCCFGRISNYGLYFPVHNAVLIPTQLYSSLILFLIFLVLKFIGRKTTRYGFVFYSYLLLYSLKRFFIEFWRADNEKVLFNLTLFQLISIILFFIGLFGIRRICQKQKR